MIGFVTQVSKFTLLRKNACYKQFYDIVQTLATISRANHTGQGILALACIEREIRALQNCLDKGQYETLYSMYEAVNYAYKRKVYVKEGDVFQPKLKLVA